MRTDGGVILLMQVKDSTRCPPSSRWQRAQAKLFELQRSAWTALTSDGPCVGGLPPAALTADGLVVVNGSARAWEWRDRRWRQVQ